MGFYLAIIIFCTCILIAYQNAVSGRAKERASKKFWDREADANHVRRADISSLDYIRFSPDELPTGAAVSAGLSDEVSTLKTLAERRIINLSMYTNTDLKEAYGPANLDELSGYDENFTVLIRTLNKIGCALLDAGDGTSASAFLSYAVSIGSDITETYTRLGSYYAETGADDLLDALIEKAAGIKTLSGATIRSKLDSIKSDVK